jgi:ribokinase
MSVGEVTAACTCIENSRVLLVQLEPPLRAVRAAIQTAHRAGVTVVMDPAPANPLPPEILHHVDVIRPNANEARALTGMDVSDYTGARLAAAFLFDRGVKAVVVQAGGEGDVLFWRQGGEAHELRLPRHDVPSVDATGAGDAFAAALAVMIAEGKSLPVAARFASAAAALKTTRLGAQAGLPRKQEVERWLDAPLAGATATKQESRAS